MPPRPISRVISYPGTSGGVLSWIVIGPSREIGGREPSSDGTCRNAQSTYGINRRATPGAFAPISSGGILLRIAADGCRVPSRPSPDRLATAWPQGDRRANDGPRDDPRRSRMRGAAAWAVAAVVGERRPIGRGTDRSARARAVDQWARTAARDRDVGLRDRDGFRATTRMLFGISPSRTRMTWARAASLPGPSRSLPSRPGSAAGAWRSRGQ